MKKNYSLILGSVLATMITLLTSADVFGLTNAFWTFEVSVPATAGPFSPEIGSGSASGSHVGAATYSNPSGNGSAESYSANTWAVGDYWQFSASTLGQSGVIVTWDQVGSSTGPRDFNFFYSTDGSSFTQVGSTYTVLLSSWTSGSYISTNSFTNDLSAITALDNQATVYFRLVDASTTAINGGTVAGAGTDRIDNFGIFTGGGGGGGGPTGITSQPANRTNNAGTTATFTVSGTNVAGYFWLKNGGSISDGNANGITSATLTITNVIAANAASYRVVLTNSINSVTSDVVTLTVIDPAINTQPANQSVADGSPASFSVSAGGTPTLTYQWRKNGGNLGGATDSTYSIGSVGAGDVGSYTVVVTNGLGAVTSSVATLTIVVPYIKFTSGNYTQDFNTLATSGTANVWSEGLTLQGWYGSRETGGSFTNYRASAGTDGTGALYSFGTGVATERALGSIASGTPDDIAYGIRFTNDHPTLARSNIVITYTGEQWRRENNASANKLAFSYRISNDAITSADGGETQIWTSVPDLDFTTPTIGATSATALDGNNATNRVTLSVTLTNVVVLTNKEIFFRWKDVDDTGTDHSVSIDDLTITSDGVVATVTPPTIATPPQSRTNVAGTTATFTVSANGTAPFNYQWRKNGSQLFDGGNTAGSLNQTLTLTTVADVDEGSYDVIVANGAGSVTSAVATLLVNDPGFFTQPTSRTNVVGDTANFFASAGGTAPVTFQWQKNGVNLTDGGNISGAILNALNVLNVSTNDEGGYTMVASSAVPNSLTSSVATLTILRTPPVLLARWDFNATNSLSTTNPAPSVGSGSSALLNGVSGALNQFGSFSDAAGPPGAANLGWQTTSYPGAGVSNKTAGVRFNVSTVDYGGIFLTWEERHSNTASKHTRLQYTADGTNFSDVSVITTATENASDFILHYADLSGHTGVNNNPNFGFRIVTEFESTATGTGSANYVGTAGSYGTGGTIRYDLVNVFAGVALKVAKSGNNAVVSWLTNFPGYTLQTKASVTAPTWSSNGLPATSIVGSNYTVTVPIRNPIPNASTNAYFRLVKTNL